VRRSRPGEGEEGEGVAPLLKSREPHLAGGEKYRTLQNNVRKLVV